MKEFKKIKARIKAAEAMLDNHKELLCTAADELKFQGLLISHLKEVLDEVEIHLKNKLPHELISVVIENAKNRHELDKIIHSKMIFYKNEY